ncbi:MAG: hypothetical protein J0I09_07930 [Sphingobacteriia bacterium]|nr:hypothetical protein [Sphingobacteriia bacterium]
MKQSIIALLILCYVTAQAEDKNPARWTYSFVKTGNQTGEIHITATIDQPWHIYAQLQPKEAIAQPTVIKLNTNPLVIADGRPVEKGKKETYRNNEVGIIQYQYGGVVEFIQKVKLKAHVKTSITGSITYQVCNEEMCLPVRTDRFEVIVDK